MEYYVSFGLTSAIMLLITITVYTYKNWIPVKKNKIYLVLLCAGITGTLVDMFVEMLSRQLPDYAYHISMFGIVVLGLLQVVISFYLLLYNMVFTGTMQHTGRLWFKLLLLVFVLAAGYTVVSPFMGFTVLNVSAESGCRLTGNALQAVFFLLFLSVGMLMLYLYRSRLTPREKVILAGSDALLVFSVVIQFMLHHRNLLSFYVLSLIFVVYYMLLHNIDRYRFLSSGCFSHSGFNSLAGEKAHYQENFYCLGFCIDNIESITNCCSEDEIAQFHCMMGDLLKKICGRHNVYHLHSFEYVIVCKDEKAVEENHRNLIQGIPLYFRLNNKNISISCDFFTLQLADAEYNKSNFYSILSTMRKLAREQMDRHKLLHYEGESEETIQKDLEAMRIVNTGISEKNFALTISPIRYAKSEQERYSYEFCLCAHYSDGSVINQEKIWELAASMGQTRELGFIVFELVCKYIHLQRLEEKGIEKVHINMTSSQLTGQETADEFLSCLERYQIPGGFICIEVNIDLAVDYDLLGSCMERLHEAGISVLLDQFGVTVCNLKTVLEMPFDAVKVSHHMVRKFYEGVSSQLTYLLDMLNVKEWKIYVDGMDERMMIDRLKELRFSYMQGAVMMEEHEQYRKEAGQGMNGGVVFD